MTKFTPKSEERKHLEAFFFKASNNARMAGASEKQIWFLAKLAEQRGETDATMILEGCPYSNNARLTGKEASRLISNYLNA
ncbi:MAG: hypothetical protein ACOC3T_00060 [Bacteroidota bacterium]